MFVKILELIGKLLILITFLGIVIGIVLFLIGWEFKKVWPPELQPKEAISPELEIAPQATRYPPIFPEIIITGTNTAIPTSDDWIVNGNGIVAVGNDFVKTQTKEKTVVYKKGTQFHNLYVELIISVKKLEDNGNYSVILRRSDACQWYDLKFSKANETTLKIELLKYFCDGGYTLLNQINVSGIVYQPYKLGVGIEGGQVVNFFVEVNGTDILRIQDTNQFIWRGDFGLSVENGEVEFTEIQLIEK